MLFKAFEATLKTSGMIFLVIIGALIFSVFVSVTGLADAVELRGRLRSTLARWAR